MTNFDIIRNDGRLLYEYIRGSHLYELNNKDSDVDTCGVFVCTRDELFGCYGYWKSRVYFPPEGEVALPPENVFILPPKEPWPVGSFLFRLTCLL